MEPGADKSSPDIDIIISFNCSDDLVQMCVDYMREYPLLVALMIGIPVFLLLSFIYLMRPDEPPKKKKKKKDKEKEKDKSKEKKEK